MQTSTLRGLIFAFALAISGGPPAMAADAPASNAPTVATIGADGVQRATLVLDSIPNPGEILTFAAGPINKNPAAVCMSGLDGGLPP